MGRLVCRWLGGLLLTVALPGLALAYVPDLPDLYADLVAAGLGEAGAADTADGLRAVVLRKGGSKIAPAPA